MKLLSKIICSVLLLGILAPSVLANPEHYTWLPFDATKTLVKVNGRGDLLAVLSGSAGLPTMSSQIKIEVWKLNRVGSLENKLFSTEIKRGVSSFNWLGDTLLYSSNTNEDFVSTSAKKDIGQYVQNYAWSLVGGKREEKRIYSSNFALESNDGKKLVVINPTNLSAKNGLQIDSKKSVPKGIPVAVYGLDKWKLERCIYLPILAPEYHSSSFTPILFSNDGNTLLARCSTNQPWSKDSYSQNDFLVHIDLKSGNFRRLTSADDPDALFVLDHGWSAPASAVSVYGQSIICALDATSRNLRYRFQIFNLSGNLVNEVKLDDIDARLRNAPTNMYPVCWTSSGEAIVQAVDGLWLVPLKKSKSRKLIGSFYDVDIVQRSKNNLFVVRGIRSGANKDKGSKWCTISP